MLHNARSMEEGSMKRKGRRPGSPGAAKQRSRRTRSLQRINPNAAGIDCGSESHHGAVPADRDPEPVRRFRTFTTDLLRLADWLTACPGKTGAMEATWGDAVPVYDIL